MNVVEEKRKAVTAARRMVRRIAIVALATTSSDGQPWSTPVYSVFDGRGFYWSSLTDAVHSVNIAANPAVFLAIFDSTAPDKSGHGVYARATARELLDQQAIAIALDALAARKGESPKPVEDYIAPQSQRVYEAVPESMWTNVVHHERGYVFDERIEIDSADLRPARRKRR
jgi:nitroimidazol reductase NimA-like FMN-containing flavoprotein (pyridoxamine 5'-phosphate oxidase superfamily)